MNTRPLILVSNDDSIYAKGVKELISRLIKFGDVVAVCPDAPRSGQSMAITVNDPIRITKCPDFEGATMYKASGTPVDCIKLAMHHILDRRPDLVVAGINHGSNASVNELYSGTMGATCEGCAFGIPSVGFSLTSHDPAADFEQCFKTVDLIVEKILKFGLPEDICLNVNIPDIGHTPEEMRICTPCRGHWNDEYREYIDPAGRKFYLLSGEFINDEPENEMTDEWCLAHGIVSIVPTSINRKVALTDSLAWIMNLPSEYQE